MYDYFIKDHLGNTRMVLTEENQADAYPAASLEDAALAGEKNYYTIPDDAGTRVNKSTVAGYPNDSYTNPNDYLHKLNGSGTKVGTSIVLKVMSGDKVNIRANSWYRLNGATPGTPQSPLTDLVAALAGGVSRVTMNKYGVTELTGSGVLSPGMTDMLGTQTYSSTKPKAYVSWVLLDEQFKYVGTGSGFDQVGGDDEFKTHVLTNIPVTKNGYLYIYESNETPNIDVFFDNLQVTHNRGPLLEESHYYPMGLLMQGISSKSAGKLENKYKYNDGTELEHQEFSDGSGLELYATDFRGYDPQIGRFHQIDPLSSMSANWSPYVYVQNNPLLYNDPLGLDTVAVKGKTGETATATNKDGSQGTYNITDDGAEGTGVSGSSEVTVKSSKKGSKSSTLSKATKVIQATVIALAADDATGIGVVDDVAIPVLEAVNGALWLWDIMSKNNSPATPAPAPQSISTRTLTPVTTVLARSWQQDKLLTPGEIDKLKKNGWDHSDKGKRGGRSDLYKDKDGNIYQKPKGGNGPGEPTGINIKDLKD